MQSELLTVRDLSAELKVSSRQCWKLLSSGRLPLPVRLGRSVRWRSADIARFVELGCPSRDVFETAKKLLEEFGVKLAMQRPIKSRLRTLGEGLIQAFLIMSSLANLVNTILNVTCTKP